MDFFLEQKGLQFKGELYPTKLNNAQEESNAQNYKTTSGRNRTDLFRAGYPIMSSTITLAEDGNRTDITVTKYATSGGSAYQVTWRSDDKEHLFDHVSFSTYEEALEFSRILNRRIKNA